MLIFEIRRCYVSMFAGLGMCVCYLSAFIAISRSFHGDPGLALVSLTIGGSAGQCIMPLIVDLLVSSYAVPSAFIVLSAVTLQCAPFALVMHVSANQGVISDALIEHHDVREKNVTSSSWSLFRRLLMDALVMIVLINSFLVALTGNP